MSTPALAALSGIRSAGRMPATHRLQAGDTVPSRELRGAVVIDGLLGAFRHAGAWLAASDPGLLRLRMGATTTVTLVLTLAILAGLAAVTGQPLTVALLGVVIAMFASMTLSEPEIRGRAVTSVLMVAASAGATSLGAFLARPLWAGQLVFLAVIVAAVLARKLGMRGTAVGMVAFISYFFALFLQATPPQLPSLVIAAAVGAAVNFGMRTVLPERPEHVVRRMLHALRGRTLRLLDTVGEQLRKPATGPARPQAPVASTGAAGVRADGASSPDR